mmetsp:Transcript_25178/g.58189  ORF Transcript_25178/g.58189 Transcript_25178/m.58189 type:complete len:100 (+) Transcript_25178:221-520(+)
MLAACGTVWDPPSVAAEYAVRAAYPMLSQPLWYHADVPHKEVARDGVRRWGKRDNYGWLIGCAEVSDELWPTTRCSEEWDKGWHGSEESRSSVVDSIRR